MQTENQDRERIIVSMKEYFGEDQRRIDHTLQVLGYAEQILNEEEANRGVVQAAAILHDIGIPEAERKHGSSAGKYQEVEGPPIARRILEEHDFDKETIDHVCKIVANHHSARDIDTPEFRIVWDADWLVNMAPQAQKTEPKELKGKIERIFKTEEGKRIAYRLFIERKAGGR